MTKDEALDLALKALETELAVDMTNGAEVGEAVELMCEAITAIKQALKDEALDLALKALETELAVDMTNGAEVGEAVELMCEAIAAIKQARSAQQEPVWCGYCNGSGRMVRDPDIGTDQECFVCDGAGVPAAPVQAPEKFDPNDSFERDEAARARVREFMRNH